MPGLSPDIVASPTAQTSRPPMWLIAATGILAVIILALAVAETNLRAHYLIDGGEYLSMFGLAFILAAGVFLYTRGRLFASLWLVFPWLLYPIITQGDQLIDNLSINPMRAICHVLLAAIFATPVAVIVLAARYVLAPRPGRRSTRAFWTAFFPGLRPLAEGKLREGTVALAVALLAAEMWLADQYLGTLMIVTLIILILTVLLYGSLALDQPNARATRARNEQVALAVLLVGVGLSTAGFFGYKNRTGAYQGSPAAFMDPSQPESGYPLDRVPVPARAPAMPSAPEPVRSALVSYARALEKIMAGYHIVDRNYTYDFHNYLFMRHTPLLPQYRIVALQMVEEARHLRDAADVQAANARSTLADDDPLGALLDDVRGYVGFIFDRAPTLERMSAEFERTPAGLQHAAHLYEGENKFLGTRLGELLTKHHAVVESPAVAPVTGEFVATSRSVRDAYAHHVVGF
jgi:hypothetical protein